MELINFIGASPSKDGKWILVTFALKGSDEKLRWIVPLPVVSMEDDCCKITLALTSYKKKEEPKEEREPLEDEDIPF